MFKKMKEWFAQLIVMMILLVVIVAMCFVGSIVLAICLVLLLLGWIYSLISND